MSAELKKKKINPQLEAGSPLSGFGAGGVAVLESGVAPAAPSGRW